MYICIYCPGDRGRKFMQEENIPAMLEKDKDVMLFHHICALFVRSTVLVS